MCPNLYKATPNYFFVFVMAIGVFFSMVFAWKIWPERIDVQGVSRSTGYIVITVLTAISFALSVLCFMLIICSKVIYLTTDSIIITMPLVFYKRVIMLNEVKYMVENDERINMSNNTFSRNLMTIGHNTTLELTDGKKVNISSLQVWRYDELIKKIKAQRRIKVGNIHH